MFSFAFHSRISWKFDDFGLHCVLFNEDNVWSSSFNHPIILYLEIPHNFETFVFYHSLRSVFVPLVGPLKFCDSIQLPMYIQYNVVVAPLILTLCHILHKLFSVYVYVELGIISSLLKACSWALKINTSVYPLSSFFWIHHHVFSQSTPVKSLTHCPCICFTFYLFSVLYFALVLY